MQKTIAITVCCLLLSLLALDASHAAKTALPRTGQTLCYDPVTNATTPCTGTGQDGAKLKGVSWPTPRFTDNLVNSVSNGTVTDNLTGLVWLKNANCFGTQFWAAALKSANTLVGNNTVCGLNDGSTAGQWRLPNSYELESLIDLSSFNPTLPSGHPFGTSVQSSMYWSGSTFSGVYTSAWYVNMLDGGVVYNTKVSTLGFVWPVRAGQ